MPKTAGAIPNLIQGISQQAPAMRLPTQAEASENFDPTIVDGLRKRPRTDHAAVLASLPEGTFTHFILRDQDEKYVVAIFTNGTIRVWDMAGVEQTVSNQGSSYLAGITNAAEDLRALTVIDYTFIVNTKKTVQAGTATEPTRPYEALINVAAGNYGKRYIIYVDWNLVGDHTTPDGSNANQSPQIDTVAIAGQLILDLGTSGLNTGPWLAQRYNSTIHLRNYTTNFGVTVEDGYNGRAMIAVKDRVQKFADLPLAGPEGFVVEVAGTDATGFDNYWVRLDKGGRDPNGAATVWKECVKPGERLGLNAATMPHILVREANGTFTFRPATWDNRKCGDLERNPDPSFVGQTIQDVFFTKNRLGFLTEDNVVMSQTGGFFNFFRATLTSLLDTDPIDTAASHIKVAKLRHAVLFQQELFVFSDSTQFVVKGNDLLTPKTVNADPLTELTATRRVRPETAATSIFFISERDSWAGLYEYFIDKALESADYSDVSDHAPTYIPAGVSRLIVSPDFDMALVTTDGDPASIYVYKFYWGGQEKLQSAWCRWRYPGADKILNMTFDRGKVWLLVRRGSSVMLESFTVEQSITDAGLPYVIYLDQSVVRTSGAYSSPSGTTTFTLPYAAPSGLRAVTVPGGTLPAGVELPIKATSGTTVTLDGNLSAQPIRFGVPFNSFHTLSQFYQRSGQDATVDENGRLQVLYFALQYAETAYFRLEVELEGRAKRVYPFVGRVISDANNRTGELVLAKGRTSIPILSRADRARITIVNDTWLPSSFLSATWRGTFNPNTRQQ